MLQADGTFGVGEDGVVDLLPGMDIEVYFEGGAEFEPEGHVSKGEAGTHFLSHLKHLWGKVASSGGGVVGFKTSARGRSGSVTTSSGDTFSVCSVSL